MTFDGQSSLESFSSYNFLAVTVNLTATVKTLILPGHLSGGENALKMKRDQGDLFGYNRQIKAPSLSL